LQDGSARRLVAGGPTAEDVALGPDTPELRALRDAERELFPPAIPPIGTPWPSELPSPLSATEDIPRVHASGLPPAPPPSAPPPSETGRDLKWLADLALPELPVRWDPRLVRYLEFFKDDPRGRGAIHVWFRRAGKYRERIQQTLRRKSVPEDLVFVAMVESGMDPTVRSPAGAAGLWQFMPETGRLYGLSSERWIDDRYNVEAATESAADFLSDLHRRFGSWDLALAAYNMGYGGMMSVVRKYNSNDFWLLAQLEGALPWETTLYVPKILAVAIVARNPAAFGFADLLVEPPLEFDVVQAPPATTLASLAKAAGVTPKELTDLNPELRAQRTPPAGPDTPKTFPVRVPSGKGAQVTQALSRIQREAPPVDRYVVRFGESLEQIATAHRIPVAKLMEMNGIVPGEVVRGGTAIFVPRGARAEGSKPAAKAGEGAGESSGDGASAGPPTRPVVVVPADVFVYPDRTRVFYRVLTGDTLREVATAFQVTVDELRRWNGLDPQARLQDGMTLQIYPPADAKLARVVAFREDEVEVLTVGTEEFFAFFEAQKNRKRISVVARKGDTLASIGRRHGMSPGMMERINRRGRNQPLDEGEVVVVYVPQQVKAPAVAIASEAASSSGPTPVGAAPDAPAPDALPPLPQLD
jgi:membrane-bound lytic murein transglycosylase D